MSDAKRIEQLEKALLIIATWAHVDLQHKPMGGWKDDLHHLEFVLNSLRSIEEKAILTYRGEDE